mmetsp:Transcript_17927/g.46404  ORF Transcript_17927/g.46404 Transcript_17927/m.46404 type:complete len:155 (-) Transcript_17927:517-981(-)
MTPRPGKVEVPIGGEVIHRRPRAARQVRGGGDEEVVDVGKIIRLDGPAKLNWLCKALPMVRRRKLQPAEFMDIVTNQRFSSNLDDAMPFGSQMVSALRSEIGEYQPLQVQQLRGCDLWARFADSDDERFVDKATTSSSLPAARAAAYAAAAAAA